MVNRPPDPAVVNALLARLAANTAIPIRVRRWAAQVAQASAEKAPDAVGPERWAYAMFALFLRESGGDPAVHGDGGLAHGLGQIHERYWPEFAALSEAEKHDPMVNARWAAKILRGEWAYWSSKGHGDQALRFALTSYNAGRRSVARALAAGRDPDSATTGGDYSADILGNAVAWINATGTGDQVIA